MKRFLLVIYALLAPAQLLHAADTLTLDEALVTALKNHPQVIEASANLKSAEAKTGQALATYYPQISVAADWSKGRSYLTALERVRTTQVNSEALYLQQTIYDFGRTAGAVEAARYNREAADQNLVVTRNDLMLRVKSAFYLLLAAEKQFEATKETVKAREEVYRQAEEFFRQGIRPKVEVTKAEANLYAARTSLIRAGNNKEIARIELAGAMGTAEQESRSLVEPPADGSPLPERQQVQLDAIRSRPELQQLSALKSAAQSALKTAKSGYLPVLSGTASLGYADRDFPPSGNVWGAGINLTVPLFSGFSSVEEVREATANVNAMEARKSVLRLQIAKEVGSAWLGCQEAMARMASTQKEVEAAEENRRLAQGRYHEGVGSIIEVTDAQSQALEAQTAHIQAGYDYRIARAALYRATGKE
uniref:Outer membrane efflux protein n=1 Tax=Geobacter sp. (strain M21) TaxID=443144 RepID=C6E161_GEOSM